MIIIIIITSFQNIYRKTNLHRYSSEIRTFHKNHIKKITHTKHHHYQIQTSPLQTQTKNSLPENQQTPTKNLHIKTSNKINRNFTADAESETRFKTQTSDDTLNDILIKRHCWCPTGHNPYTTANINIMHRIIQSPLGKLIAYAARLRQTPALGKWAGVGGWRDRILCFADVLLFPDPGVNSMENLLWDRPGEAGLRIVVFQVEYREYRVRVSLFRFA